jgi:hypothetical protein
MAANRWSIPALFSEDMGVVKRKRSARAERRANMRTTEKLARSRERLAQVEPGGVPQRPIQVESASLVEPVAMAMTCLRCGERNRLEEHAAITVNGEGLRSVVLCCARCGTKRALWFRIAPLLPN